MIILINNILDLPYAAELVQQNQFFQIMVCRFFSGQNVQKCQ